MLPNFREISSNYPLIVASMHSMPALQTRDNLHKEKPKVRTNVSNEGKCVKTNG